MFTHFLTSTKLTPVYNEAQSLTLCARPSELLLQCVRAYGVCSLHPPPTYLGWSWILCPPVSHFLPVSLTAFTVTSVSCVTLICLGMGMGKNGRWGGEGIRPHRPIWLPVGTRAPLPHPSK